MHKPKRLPVVREDGTIEIYLSKGQVVIIDWVDAWLCGRSWSTLTTPTGHTYATCNRRLLHREIFGLGFRNGQDVDHKDGDTLNCRRENLRVVSHQKNTTNRKINSNNTTGFMGVSFQKRSGLFTATIAGEYLGAFATAELAHRARVAAECELWGVQPQRAGEHVKDLT